MNEFEQLNSGQDNFAKEESKSWNKWRILMKNKVLIYLMIMLIPFMLINLESKVEASSSAFITEWKIPANADGAGLGTTIKLPIPSNGNSFTVDWGDGKTNTYTTEDFPSHTYTNTTETTYSISINGTVRYFGHTDEETVTETNIYKDYYTATKYITKLVQWGEINAYRYGFAHCTNLIGTIPVPTVNSFKEATDFIGTFESCTSLTGPIPAELFQNAPNVESFDCTFANCTSLKGSIPENLFINNHKVKYLDETFFNCTSLTGNIPERLFENTSKVVTFEDVFYNCKELTGSIPASLFETTTEVTNAQGIFYGCSRLSGEIPETLFEAMEKVTTVQAIFYECSGLSGSISKDLFKNTTLLENIEFAFTRCSNLTGEISAELFATTPNINSFKSVFEDCSRLTGEIPASLFENTKNVTNFNRTFFKCSGLTGEIPASLFASTPNVTTYYGTFYECTNLTGHVSGDLFKNNIAITEVPAEWNIDNEEDSYAATFAYTGITSAEINTLYVGAGMFAGCNSLVDIKIGNNVQAIGIDGFQVYDPYTPYNLLITNLESDNEIAINYSWPADYRNLNSASIFVTEWTIPVDVNGAGQGTTIQLPIPSYDINNYTVEWGDGTTEIFTTEAFPSHTYKNTEVIKYSIRISGTVIDFGYADSAIPEKENTYKDYYTYTQYLTGIKQWGIISASRYGFANCINLSGEIPSPEDETFKYTTLMEGMFYNCTNLTGSIPTDLFKNASEVTTARLAFYNCTGLTGKIPEDLFADMEKVSSLGGVFNGCSGLTDRIPEKLFENTKKVTDLSFAFYGCTGLTGSIPESLFANTTEVTTLEALFYECSGLKWEIPASLFASMTGVTNLSYTFYGCSGLTGDIPINLFEKNPSVNTFAATFYGCSGLTGNISEEMFASNTAITELPTETDAFMATFAYCENIVSANINTLYCGNMMFMGCQKLTDITIGSNVQQISSIAFYVYEPYSQDNLLMTYLTTENTVATDYSWPSDNRILFSGSSSAFITEWTIPVDADGTAGGGTTILLSIPSASTNNYTVDWGDGTKNSYTTQANPTHTYKNTVEKKYLIQITGKMNEFATLWNSDDNAKKYITGLIQWGEVGATHYAFEYCENLSGTIPEPTKNSFINTTSFESTFSDCYKLTGSIPANLFANASKVTNFIGTFYGCSGLTGSIPANLFANTPNVLYFSYDHRRFKRCFCRL